MYYKIEPVYKDETITIDRRSHWDYSLTLGEIQPKDMPEPIEYQVDTEIGGTYLPATFLPESVFSNAFIKKLLDYGVDNIQTYKVNIVNPDTNQGIEGYQAVNIIGKISCADMDASECERLIEDQYIFRKLVINPLKTHGAYMFRLGQCTQIILIHEDIVKQLPPEICKDLNFEPVDETGTFCYNKSNIRYDNMHS